jgi:hypothetical protein
MKREFRRNRINRTSVVTVILVLTAGVVTFRETFGETTAYTVAELSGAGRVPCRLNNLGDVAGRAGDSPSGETRATIWNRASLRPTNLVTLAAANIVLLRVSTTREKSLELRISLSRSFHLSGRRQAAFGGFRCCLATTADRRWASTSTANVAGYSSGSTGSRAFIWRGKNGSKKS